jgi:hypothetical protein
MRILGSLSKTYLTQPNELPPSGLQNLNQAFALRKTNYSSPQTSFTPATSLPNQMVL